MPIRSTLIALVAALLILTGCGTGNPLAGDAGDADSSAAADTGETTDVVATVDEEGLFASSSLHDIEMTFDQDDYDAMIENLADTGDKDWIEVTVTIDGVTYEQAGARLKGNSSLAGLSGGGPGGRGFGGRAARGDDAAADDAAEDAAEDDGADVPERPGGGGLGSASAEEPEGLPWLIRLDKFVDGQSHDGYVDLVIRSNNSETSLNEAVALDLLEEAGLASQEAASVRFSVNGSESTLRLMIEHPSDDAWQDLNFDNAGGLYKAESTGDWSYRGDDPDSYDEVFDQEGGAKVTDLTPLIEFLQFVNESDDETFAAELPERLDVESFATYLAMMDLIDNFDDIDGPGNNAYIWWDAETEQFTVVPWDMNLAFGGGGFGGPGGGGGFGRRVPEGFELPEGFEPPEGFQPGAGGPGGGSAGFGGGGFGGRSNPLVERFLANAEFEALYQSKLTELRAELFDSGVAESILDDWVTVLTDQATDVVDAATVEQEAEAIASALSGS